MPLVLFVCVRVSACAPGRVCVWGWFCVCVRVCSLMGVVVVGVGDVDAVAEVVAWLSAFLTT